MLFILNSYFSDYIWCDRNPKYLFQDVNWTEQKKRDFTQSKNFAIKMPNSSTKDFKCR
jgi:hypothetical protein